MATRTRWQCITMIVERDFFTTTCTSICAFTRLFSSRRHFYSPLFSLDYGTALTLKGQRKMPNKVNPATGCINYNDLVDLQM